MAHDLAEHPSRLSLSSRLHGGPAASGRGLRVLEIGRQGGEALIALAFHDPEGAYLGAFEDPASVEAGRAAAVEIGLTNVRFEPVSLDEPPMDLGVFDVVLARDALAWAPEMAQSEVLRLCHASLSESGILALGYPVLPGAANRGLVRTLLAPHVGTSSPGGDRERVARAKASAEAFRAMLGPSGHPYPQLLGMELTRFLEASPEAALRDYLDAPEAVFAHSDVVKLAEAHGLRFVCDAMWNRPDGFVAPEIAEDLALRGLTGADLDQALDVLRCRAERTSIFCRAEPVSHSIGAASPGEDRAREVPGPEILDDLWIASALAPASETVDLGAEVEVSFSGEPGQRIASADPLLKAALVELHACWPRPLRFAEVVSAAVERLHEAGADGEPNDVQLAGVARDLWELHRRGLIDLLPERPSPRGGPPAPEESTPREGESHVLHALARFQVRTGADLTSPLAGKVPLDKFTTSLLPHMTPDATEDSLVRAMLVEASKGGVSIEIGGTRLTDAALLEPMIRALVRRSVSTLARHGVLE